MTDKAISPLRRRMIEDMTIRKLGPKTQAGYIRAVRNFAEFLGHSPDLATIEDIRRYQLRLASSGLGVPSVNAAMTAIPLSPCVSPITVVGFRAAKRHARHATYAIPSVRSPFK
jgi:Phage integrase, N-terminal SAM-like domain